MTATKVIRIITTTSLAITVGGAVVALSRWIIDVSDESYLCLVPPFYNEYLYVYVREHENSEDYNNVCDKSLERQLITC